MWFKRKRPPPIRSLVCEGTVLNGELCFVDGLRIDGEVHGDVICAAEGHSLLVHVLHTDDPDAVRDEIKSRYERRLLEIFV